MFEPTQLAWHNGRIVQLEQAAPSIASHSLHLGISVFDGMMAYWNNDHYYVHRMSEHFQRLRRGSQYMGLEFSWSEDELRLGVELLLKKIPPANYYIRPIVYRPSPQINVTDSENMPVDVAIFGVIAPRNVDQPLSCHISPVERVSSRAIPVAWKVGGTYVNSYLVRQAAKQAGFDDGLMTNREGKILEASAANLFFLDADSIITPSTDPDIFPGITRLTIIDLAKSLGIEVIERDIKVHEVLNYEGAFLASTLMELKPIDRLETQYWNSSKHPVFLKLLSEFREITEKGENHDAHSWARENLPKADRNV
jgi:branched-chain amino acid aminotransferase